MKGDYPVSVGPLPATERRAFFRRTMTPASTGELVVTFMPHVPMRPVMLVIADDETLGVSVEQITCGNKYHLLGSVPAALFSFPGRLLRAMGDAIDAWDRNLVTWPPGMLARKEAIGGTIPFTPIVPGETLELRLRVDERALASPLAIHFAFGVLVVRESITRGDFEAAQRRAREEKKP